MCILGIDFSLRGPGVCIISDKGEILLLKKLEQKESKNKKTNNLQTLFFTERDDTDPDNLKKEEISDFVIKTDNGFYKIDRAQLLENWIIEIIKDFDITEAFIEGYAFGASGNLIDIAEAFGSIKKHLRFRGIIMNTIAPTSLKKKMTGNGRASKIEMISQAEILSGREIYCDDTSDAYALCITGLEDLKKAA